MVTGIDSIHDQPSLFVGRTFQWNIEQMPQSALTAITSRQVITTDNNGTPFRESNDQFDQIYSLFDRFQCMAEPGCHRFKTFQAPEQRGL